VDRTYRLFARKMLNQSGERTLICSIAPAGTTHINGIIGFVFKNDGDMLLSSGLWASLPYDFLIKTLGKANLNFDSAASFPVTTGLYNSEIKVRSLLLNCLTDLYAKLYNRSFIQEFRTMSWTNKDARLGSKVFTDLPSSWNMDAPLRTDYRRHQALVELDVLTSMALGMTLDELISIYQIQFPVLQQHEADTWYDTNGRIVLQTIVV